MKKNNIMYLRRTEAGSYFPYDLTTLTDLADKTEVIEVRVLGRFVVERIASLRHIP